MSKNSEAFVAFKQLTGQAPSMLLCLEDEALSDPARSELYADVPEVFGHWFVAATDRQGGGFDLWHMCLPFSGGDPWLRKLGDNEPVEPTDDDFSEAFESAYAERKERLAKSHEWMMNNCYGAYGGWLSPKP